MSSVPNLYSFATKELAQDATIAYILAWADPIHCERYSRLHELGTALLRGLLVSYMRDSDVPRVTSLHVETQTDRIDILVRINDEDKDGLLLLIEDKVDAHEHSNQVERYKKKASKRYPGRRLVPVYLKTGNACMARLPKEADCGRFLRKDLLDILNRFSDVSDTIIENFRRHLQRWEDETYGFSSSPIGEWDWHSIQGLYMELESRMSRYKDDGWKFSLWGYTHNQTGGFQFYAFAWNTIKVDVFDVSVYLQIEDAKRLTLRLGHWNGYRIRSNLMYKVLHIARDVSGKTGSMNVRKAGRFRGGKSAAVAEIAFGSNNEYLLRKENGAIDIDATVGRLDQARALVKEIAVAWSGA